MYPGLEAVRGDEFWKELLPRGLRKFREMKHSFLLFAVLVLHMESGGCGQDPIKVAAREKFVQLLSPSQSDWDAIQDPAFVAVLKIDDDFEREAVTDQSLENLSKFPNLRTLVLYCPLISNDGLKHIAERKELEALAIYQCQINDQGIEQLNALTKLEILGFWNPNVTSAGIDRLKATLRETQFDLAKYGDGGKVFDSNGCLTFDFFSKHCRLRNLSGETEVDKLGKVALPPGKWALERSHLSTDEEKTPDVFVFRKAGDVTERLSILRYRANIAPKRPIDLADSVGDSMLFGIPHFLEPDAKMADDAAIHMLRMPSNIDAEKIEITYIYPDRSDTLWMSHAVICLQDGCAFVCLHCAPKVLSPDTILSVYFESSMKPTADTKR